MDFIAACMQIVHDPEKTKTLKTMQTIFSLLSKPLYPSQIYSQVQWESGAVGRIQWSDCQLAKNSLVCDELMTVIISFVTAAAAAAATGDAVAAVMASIETQMAASVVTRQCAVNRGQIEPVLLLLLRSVD